MVKETGNNADVYVSTESARSGTEQHYVVLIVEEQLFMQSRHGLA